MALPTYFTGTVSVAAGGTVVTGSGALWSGINAKQGDFISIDGLPEVLITEVTDATHLKIAPWGGAAKTNVTYAIYQNYVGRVVGVAAAEDVGDMLEKLHVDGLPFIVGAEEAVPDPSYGDEGQLAFKPSTGEWWVKEGGAWVRAFGPDGASPPLHHDYDTRTQAMAAMIEMTVNFVRLAGFGAAGDGGAALYRRVASSPAHGGAFQSADGAWWELSEAFVNPMMFGGFPNDGFDSAPAINAALVYSHAVYLPPGTFNIGSPINFTKIDTNFLTGSGSDGTILNGTFTGGPIINVRGVSGGPYPHTKHWGVTGVTITRSVPANFGDDGIVTAHCNRATIEDVMATRQDVGINLNTCIYGQIRNTVCMFNYNDGLRLAGTVDQSGLGWEISDVLAQANGGNGISVTTVAGPIGAAPLGSWQKVYTYANNQFGVYVNADPACPIFNIRLLSGFIGSDGLGGIYLNTYNPGDGGHVLSNLTMELNGMTATGPDLTTPASFVGKAIEITANNTHVAISNFAIGSMADSGISSLAGKLVLNNGVIANCGAGLHAGDRNGITIAGGSATITNVTAYNTTGGVWQQCGIVIGAGADGVLIDNCDFSFQAGNSLQNILNLSTGLNNEFKAIKGNNYRGTTMLAVGASPFVYRAGPMQEALFMYGGTVTGMSVDGQGVAAAPVMTFTLAPNKTVTIAYTAAPTIVRAVH